MTDLAPVIFISSFLFAFGAGFLFGFFIRSWIVWTATSNRIFKRQASIADNSEPADLRPISDLRRAGGL